MKTILTTTIFSVLVLFSVAYTACNKPPYEYTDPCLGVSCQNSGVCIDGKCSCTAGYYGDNCEKRSIASYLGKWAVTQQIIASGNQSTIGSTKTYDITITEDPGGVTWINVNGFLGNSSFNATWRVGMKPGTINVDSSKIEADLPSVPTDFVFKRYQALSGSSIQVIRGSGSINELATQMSGEFTIMYPDPVKGTIEDKISFTASYIN